MVLPRDSQCCCLLFLEQRLHKGEEIKLQDEGDFVRHLFDSPLSAEPFHIDTLMSIRWGFHPFVFVQLAICFVINPKNGNQAEQMEFSLQKNSLADDGFAES